MKKIGVKRVGKRDVQLFILGVALLLFNWPVLTIALKYGVVALYGYLFGSWLVVILLLFGLARSVDAESPSEHGKAKGDDV